MSTVANSYPATSPVLTWETRCEAGLAAATPKGGPWAKPAVW